MIILQLSVASDAAGTLLIKDAVHYKTLEGVNASLSAMGFAPEAGYNLRNGLLIDGFFAVASPVEITYTVGEQRYSKTYTASSSELLWLSYTLSGRNAPEIRTVIHTSTEQSALVKTLETVPAPVREALLKIEALTDATTSLLSQKAASFVASRYTVLHNKNNQGGASSAPTQTKSTTYTQTKSTAEDEAEKRKRKIKKILIGVGIVYVIIMTIFGLCMEFFM